MNKQIMWDNSQNPAENYELPDIQIDTIYQLNVGKKTLIGLSMAVVLLTSSDLAARNNVNCNSVENYVENAFILDDYQSEVAFFTDKSHTIYLKKETINNSIDNFISLNNNWDGYGAIPLEVASAQNARSFFNLLPIELLKNFHDGYPNTHGTISFEWINETGEEFFLEIGNKNVSYYLMLKNNNIISNDNAPYNQKTQKHIISLLKRL